MAYTHPPHHDARGPPPDPMRRDEPRQGWGPPPYHPSAYNQRPPSSLSSRDVMDPEDSASDVSVGGNDPYIMGGLGEPTPPNPLKQSLESVDAINARISELNHVEDANIHKQNALTDKRRRLDDRIRMKREAQDRKIHAIYAARERRDGRIRRRREVEDARFRTIDEQIEEEHNSLKRRVKRLKRGLPLEDSPQQPHRHISTSSMSPPGPSLSTIPPPAKRHQSGPPSQNDNILPPPQSTLPPPPPGPPPGSQSGPPPGSQSGPPPGPPPGPPSAPSYSFYSGSQQPYSVPYHPPTTYSTVPPPHPAPQMQPIPPHGSQTPNNDRPPYAMNGRPASPMARHPPPHANNVEQPTNQPRQPSSSSYDTRPPPPPPVSSGFAPINAPSHSGFATVNVRPGATPPGAYSNVAPPVMDTRPPNAAFPEAQNEPQRYHTNGKANDSTHSTPTGGAAGKRAPSTTHPYQMSEAFANRHHHCERVDGLNRGIWTYHGPNLGTAEHPTGPPVEMYLRCNHDGCRRIDWRTVHGLQCHIVKNHDQPKGTIGSLEKALDRYGIPVAEIEEYEREHGEGAGGTMADPKNLKIKNKLREGGRKSAPTPAPGSWGLEPTARPAGYKPSPSSDNVGKIVVEKGMGDFVSRRAGGLVEDVNIYEPDSSTTPNYDRPPNGPNSRFDVMKTQWNNSTPSRPPPHSVDVNRQLQGDAVMADQDSPARHPPPPQNSTAEVRSWNTAPANIRPYAPSAPSPMPNHVAILQNNPPDSPLQPMHQAQLAKPNASASPSEPTQNSVQEKDDQKHEPVDQSSATNTVPNGHPDGKDINMTEAPEKASQERDDEREDSPAVEDHPYELADDAMDVDSKKDPNLPAKPAMEQEGAENESKESPAPAEAPAKSTRASLHSPTINNKSLPPPVSAKRGRRSSAARRLSQDISTEGQPTAPSSNADDTEKGSSSKGPDDGEESITVVTKKQAKEDELKDKEVPKTPPRRNAGRLSRRKNAG